MKKVYAIGIGPGDAGYLAPRAKEVIASCSVVVGYTAYIRLIEELLVGKEVIDTGMTGEVERCERALLEAGKGKQVAVISSGDAGIYGMAALLYELREKHKDVELEVIAGITAASAAAAILGSPLANDFAVISLSDLLTPWAVIEKRLAATAQADMVVCLYNPQSQKRSDYLAKACNIFLRYKSPETCCGYVKNALREDCEYRTCSLKELAQVQVDMFTTVIIGNSTTKLLAGKLVTTRGYKL